MISNQCAAGRHAGGYAPSPPGSRIVGDQFQPPCSGQVKVRQPVDPRDGVHRALLYPCTCTCHTPGAKLT